MKTLKRLSLAAMLILPAMSFAAAGDDRYELDDVICQHWTNPDADADMAVRFKYQGNDFAKVTVNETFTSRFLKDPINVVIAEKTAQVASSDAHFSVDDLEGFSVVIDRPIGWHGEQTAKGTLTFDNGETVDLLCWKE